MWNLWDVVNDPMVSLPLLMAVLIGVYLLTEIWTKCRGNTLVLRKQGIETKRYGLIPWEEINKVDLALPPEGVSIDSAALCIYVRDLRKYRSKVTNSSLGLLRHGVGKRPVFENALTIGLDGLNHAPKDIHSVIKSLLAGATNPRD